MSDRLLASRPVIRVRFDLPDGSLLEREWTYGEQTPAWLRMVPDWLEDPQRTWDHPQDPITFTGRVKEGREAEAFQVVRG
jgi:hypothetical protein